MSRKDDLTWLRERLVERIENRQATDYAIAQLAPQLMNVVDKLDEIEPAQETPKAVTLLDEVRARRRRANA